MNTKGKYDPSHVRAFYDEYGEREWARHERTNADKVSYHLHRWYLRQYIKPGDRVLEAGAGPGRFTIELARLGAWVTVGDISPKQLELNREKVREAGGEGSVTAREVMDITDLSRFADAGFDAVVCYGGPLSYVFDRANAAVAEMLRVTKPGGYLLLSVMSLLGTTRWSLAEILKVARELGPEAVRRVNETGDLDGSVPSTHRIHMYRWAELKALLERHPCRIVTASAANFLAVRNEEALREIEDDPGLWESFLNWELDFGREPGAIDGGSHIIVVVQRNTD